MNATAISRMASALENGFDLDETKAEIFAQLDDEDKTFLRRSSHRINFRLLCNQIERVEKIAANRANRVALPANACPRCDGSGNWANRNGYTCYRCKGSGVLK